MDKYIIGHTSKSYSINGIVIPKRSTSRGAADVVKVSEVELEGLMKTKLFNSLLGANSVKVLDTKPSWAVSVADRMSTLQDEVAILKKKNKASGSDLRKELTSAFEVEKATFLAGKTKELADQAAAFEAEKASMTSAWETEKAAIIAEATTEINRLKALLPKATE